MASTGRLAFGVAGQSTQTSTHKPTSRAAIAVASRQGTIGSARTPTGRLVTVIWTRSKAAKAVTRSGRLAVALSGRVTVARNSRPKGRLPIAFSTRQASASVTLRRPVGRVVIPVGTKATTTSSTRSSATGRGTIIFSTRAPRSLTRTMASLTFARGPLHNPHIYAITQEKIRHSDALLWYGEMTAWILFWNERDFRAGYVDRCSVCYVPLGAIADTYKQTPQQKCPNCYGTTFEGGVRAIVYRPGLWDDDAVKQEDAARGGIVVKRARVNLPSDIEARDNDVGVRADGTRWKIDQPLDANIVTGFYPTTSWDTLVGTYGTAQLLDPDSVAYTVPVDLAFLQSRIGWNPLLPYPSTPPDLVNGPLLIRDAP